MTGSDPTDEAVARHRRQFEHEVSWAGPDAVAVGEDDLHPSVARRCAYPVYWHTVMVVQEGQSLLGRDHREVSPPLRSLALDPRLLGTRGDKSRVTGDCHARICGSREVRPLPATRPLCSDNRTAIFTADAAGATALARQGSTCRDLHRNDERALSTRRT